MLSRTSQLASAIVLSASFLGAAYAQTPADAIHAHNRAARSAGQGAGPVIIGQTRPLRKRPKDNKC